MFFAVPLSAKTIVHPFTQLLSAYDKRLGWQSKNFAAAVKDSNVFAFFPFVKMTFFGIPRGFSAFFIFLHSF
jgi:hypothetical protein